MTPKQKRAFDDLDAVVKTLIGKVFELEEENTEINERLARAEARMGEIAQHPAPPEIPLPAAGEKGPDETP